MTLTIGAGTGCAASPEVEEEMGETTSQIQGSNVCVSSGTFLVARHNLQLRKERSPASPSRRVVQEGEVLTPRGSLCENDGFLLATDAGGNTGWVWIEYVYFAR